MGSLEAGSWKLERPPYPVRQLTLIAPAEGEPGAVSKEDYVLAVEPRLQLFHSFDVDDVRAVDAEEAVGVELGFDRVHRFPEEMRFGADVQLDVVARGFDPVDFGGA